MKRYIVTLLLIAGISGALAQARRGYAQFSKTASATGTPVQFTNAITQAGSVTVLGKSAPRTDNVGDVYIGITSGNDTQAYKIAPGGEVVIPLGVGEVTDLQHWYVDVTTANDGVTVIYR